MRTIGGELLGHAAKHWVTYEHFFYRAAWSLQTVSTLLLQQVVAPLVREFSPTLVALSAGYDAHRADPLAQCMVDERGFAGMAAIIREAAREVGAPILACLEGGYDVEALAASVIATIEALGDGAAPPAAPRAGAALLPRLAGRACFEVLSPSGVQFSIK